MKLRDLLGMKPAAGSRYDGLSAYFDPSESALRGIVPGQWAIDAAGRPRFRLVIVDDQPGDPDGLAFHYEVARKGDPIFRHAPTPGNTIDFEVAAEGSAAVNS